MLFELMTDDGSIARLRRSTMIMSLLILVFASLRFNSNQIDFFGLMISFDQVRFILIARIFLVYVAVSYCLRIFVFYQSSRIQVRRKSLEIDEQKNVASRIHKRNEERYQRCEDDDANGQYDVDPYDEEDQGIMAEEKQSKDDKSVVLDRQQKHITCIKKSIDAIFYYVLPIVLAIAAIIFPALLSQILDFFQGQ